MKFADALVKMSEEGKERNCYEDSDRKATYTVVDGKLAIWVNPLKEWKAVNENVNELMEYDFYEVADPSTFRFTFTEAIQIMKEEGVIMRNEVYPSVVYKYKPLNGKDMFTFKNTAYPDEPGVRSTGFDMDEVEAKWGYE